MVIKSIAVEFVKSQKVGMVPWEINIILRDVMGSRNSKNIGQRWSRWVVGRWHHVLSGKLFIRMYVCMRRSRNFKPIFRSCEILVLVLYKDAIWLAYRTSLWRRFSYIYDGTSDTSKMTFLWRIRDVTWVSLRLKSSKAQFFSTGPWR